MQHLLIVSIFVILRLLDFEIYVFSFVIPVRTYLVIAEKGGPPGLLALLFGGVELVEGQIQSGTDGRVLGTRTEEAAGALPGALKDFNHVCEGFVKNLEVDLPRTAFSNDCHTLLILIVFYCLNLWLKVQDGFSRKTLSFSNDLRVLSR